MVSGAGEGHVSWPGVACIATGALFGYSSRAFKRCVSPATAGRPRAGGTNNAARASPPSID